MVGGGKDREEMREILFKAKRIDNGEWVEGHLIQSPYMGEVRSWISTPEDKTRLRAIATYYGDWRAVEVGTDTICQFTGLTDKNGNKIWENDVVWIGTTDRAIVIFSDNYSGYILQPIGDFYFDSPMLADNVDIIDSIIGNIFDNHDLLKGE